MSKKYFSAITGFIAGGASAVSNTEKSGFPWWIVIVAAVIIFCGYRYKSYRDVGKSKQESLFNIIPGRIIGNIVEKINPSIKEPVEPVSSHVAPEVDENGYLKKSNTAAIRPMYSNVPANKEENNSSSSETNRSAAAPASVNRKPSVKRPVNHSTTSTPVKKAAYEGAYEESVSAPVKKPEVDSPVKTVSAEVPRRRPASHEESTMNRPDAGFLNVNATPSAASIVFRKEAHEEKPFAPAIATAILPPIQEERKRVSPFKPNSSNEIGTIYEDKPQTSTTESTPAIARFTEIPLLEKPVSPFKPINTDL